MINHELFKKDSIVHGLLSSTSYPNILIPVKIQIKDVEYDHNNPRYLVKILYFYDNRDFLRKYIYDCNFKRDFTRTTPPQRIALKEEHLKSTQTLLDKINELEENAYCVIDSVMVKKHKTEILDLFNKIEDYLIGKVLREWKNRTTRPLYNGKFDLDTRDEWVSRFKKGFLDRIEKNTEDPENIIKELYFDSTSRDFRKLNK